MSDHGDDDDDSNEISLDRMHYSNARMGICSVCHFSIKSVDAIKEDFEKALLCSEGHFLCHRCVQRFGIRLDTSCVLCTAVDSELLMTNVPLSSSPKSDIKTRLNPRSELRWNTTAYNKFVSSSTNLASHYDFREYTEENCNDTEVNDGNHNEYIDDKIPSKLSMKPQEIFYSVDQTKNSTCSSSIIKSQESCYSMNQTKLGSASSNMKIHQFGSQMMTECSRRPIQCPRLDCAVNVAFSALTNHFIFDHPEVPILTVDPNEKITLIVNFDGLDYDSSRCLALLLVAEKISDPGAKQFNGNCIRREYKNRLPLPILGARLRSSKPGSSKSSTGEGNLENSGDMIIVWVAGLDIGHSSTGVLRCSIQASDSTDSEFFRSLTYTGPINSLRTAQKPMDVLCIGDCVTLHEGFINHTTSVCGGLNVSITIH